MARMESHNAPCPPTLYVQSDPTTRAALTPGGCQIGHMCDQNSTYGLSLIID
jgi:hypothetical protein